MDELRARAAKYITIKENAKASNRAEAPSVPTGVKRKKVGRYDAYTPLNANRDAIIQEAYNLELVRLAQPLQSLPNANPTKRWSGDTTKECIKVRDLIENQIRSGSLNHFIQQSQGSRDRGRGGNRGGGGPWRGQGQGHGRGQARPQQLNHKHNPR